MFDESFSIYIGIVIIIFIFCIFLVIFAPKSQNFFDKTIYNKKLDELSNSKIYTNALLETSVLLNIEESDDMNDNETMEKLKQYKDIKKYTLKWEKWPDKNTITGDVFILPIFMFSTINKVNSDIFKNLLNIIKDIPDIQSIYFIKLNANAKFIKHKGISELTNKTLRYIYCFNSYCYNENECGIWINSESKKTSKGDSYIYDSSKEHSLYNSTSDDIIYLIIDFDRPESIPNGYSDYTLSKEVFDDFKKII